MKFLNNKIGIDLGTCNSVVFIPGKGAVLEEPSVVAVALAENKILAVGTEAKEMTGRTPDTIRVYRPLKDGVIADYRITEAMLRYFIERAGGRFRLLKPELMIGVPAGITSTERRAVIEAGMAAGAKAVFVAKEPILAAIGASIPINSCSGHMIVDIGGGTSEVAVISLGGLVLSKSLRIAGDKLDEDIIYFSQEEYKLLVGERMAEDIKIGIGSACPSSKDERTPKEMPLRGRNLVTGLPEEIMVSEEAIRHALEKSVRQIVDTIKATIEETPPELLADIMSSGIYLSGGGALLKGLDVLINKETRILTKIIDDPLTAVVRGAGMVLENLDELREVLVNTELLEPPK